MVQVKLPCMLQYPKWASVCVPVVALLIQLPANALRKEWKTAQALGSLPLRWVRYSNEAPVSQHGLGPAQALRAIWSLQL